MLNVLEWCEQHPRRFRLQACLVLDKGVLMPVEARQGSKLVALTYPMLLYHLPKLEYNTLS